jgi:hypothetical protein
MVNVDSMLPFLSILFEQFSVIQSQEPGVIQFKSMVHEMQFKITLDPNTMQSLHLSIFPASEHYKNPWLPEDLQTLERFVEVKVLCAPYKPNAFNSITRLLNVPYEVLKDCIHIMKLELVSLFYNKLSGIKVLNGILQTGS